MVANYRLVAWSLWLTKDILLENIHCSSSNLPVAAADLIANFTYFVAVLKELTNNVSFLFIGTRIPRISGSVCGQDPRYCKSTQVPDATTQWPDDITKWPVRINLSITFDHMSIKDTFWPHPKGQRAIYSDPHVLKPPFFDMGQGKEPQFGSA